MLSILSCFLSGAKDAEKAQRHRAHVDCGSRSSDRTLTRLFLWHLKNCDLLQVPHIDTTSDKCSNVIICTWCVFSVFFFFPFYFIPSILILPPTLTRANHFWWQPRIYSSMIFSISYIHMWTHTYSYMYIQICRFCYILQKWDFITKTFLHILLFLLSNSLVEIYPRYQGELYSS